VKENELLRLVLSEFRLQGWTCAHFGNSVKYVRKGDSYMTIPDKNATGFPDIVATRLGQLLFIELKSEKGRIRDEQALWLADLRLVEQQMQEANRVPDIVQVYVWRPVDWEDGTIQGVAK
jgi:hypothetical protein